MITASIPVRPRVSATEAKEPMEGCGEDYYAVAAIKKQN